MSEKTSLLKHSFLSYIIIRPTCGGFVSRMYQKFQVSTCPSLAVTRVWSVDSEKLESVTSLENSFSNTYPSHSDFDGSIVLVLTVL